MRVSTHVLLLWCLLALAVAMPANAQEERARQQDAVYQFLMRRDCRDCMEADRTTWWQKQVKEDFESFMGSREEMFLEAYKLWKPPKHGKDWTRWAKENYFPDHVLHEAFCTMTGRKKGKPWFRTSSQRDACFAYSMSRDPAPVHDVNLTQFICDRFRASADREAYERELRDLLDADTAVESAVMPASGLSFEQIRAVGCSRYRGLFDNLFALRTQKTAPPAPNSPP